MISAILSGTLRWASAFESSLQSTVSHAFCRLMKHENIRNTGFHPSWCSRRMTGTMWVVERFGLKPCCSSRIVPSASQFSLSQ